MGRQPARGAAANCTAGLRCLTERISQRRAHQHFSTRDPRWHLTYAPPPPTTPTLTRPAAKPPTNSRAGKNCRLFSNLGLNCFFWLFSGFYVSGWEPVGGSSRARSRHGLEVSGKCVEFPEPTWKVCAVRGRRQHVLMSTSWCFGHSRTRLIFSLS